MKGYREYDMNASPELYVGSSHYLVNARTYFSLSFHCSTYKRRSEVFELKYAKKPLGFVDVLTYRINTLARPKSISAISRGGTAQAQHIILTLDLNHP